MNLPRAVSGAGICWRQGALLCWYVIQKVDPEVGMLMELGLLCRVWCVRKRSSCWRKRQEKEVLYY